MGRDRERYPERNDLMVSMRLNGASMREIARATGVKDVGAVRGVLKQRGQLKAVVKCDRCGKKFETMTGGRSGGRPEQRKQGIVVNRYCSPDCAHRKRSAVAGG